MNNFLRTGQKSGDDAMTTQNINGADCDMKMNVEHHQQQQQQSEAGEESSALTEIKMITSNQPKIEIDMDNVLRVIENAENGEKSMETTGDATSSAQTGKTSNDESGHNSNKLKVNCESHKRGAVTGPDPTKPLQPKAKLLRQQRKAEKLLAKANASSENTTLHGPIVTATIVAKKVPKNIEKTLKSFIDETPINGKHKLKVCEKMRI